MQEWQSINTHYVFKQMYMLQGRRNGCRVCIVQLQTHFLATFFGKGQVSSQKLELLFKLHTQILLASTTTGLCETNCINVFFLKKKGGIFSNQNVSITC